jgi:hypothetical protein
MKRITFAESVWAKLKLTGTAAMALYAKFRQYYLEKAVTQGRKSPRSMSNHTVNRKTAGRLRMELNRLLIIRSSGWPGERLHGVQPKAKPTG